VFPSLKKRGSLELTQSDAKMNKSLEAALSIALNSGRSKDSFWLSRLLLERKVYKRHIFEAYINQLSNVGLKKEHVDFLAIVAQELPNDFFLHNVTAGLYGSLNMRDLSQQFATKAAAIKPLSPSRILSKSNMNVLVLQTISSGGYRYIPKSNRFLMPGINELYTFFDPHIKCHRLLVDSLDGVFKALGALPPIDIVFNSISDPDMTAALLKASVVCKYLNKPVINEPSKVIELARSTLHIKCINSEGVMAAKAIYLPPEQTDESHIRTAMSKYDIKLPAIIRAAGFQGGQHMVLACDIKQDTNHLYRGNGLYIIEFIDVSFKHLHDQEGIFYPKYRAMFVGNKLIPVHLFVSDQYEVHRKTSYGMLDKFPWINDMEEDYIMNPAAHFPCGKWEQLEKKIASFGLEFVGVDFALSSRPGDGHKIMIFECNPSMRNRLTYLPEGNRVQKNGMKQLWRPIIVFALNPASLLGSSSLQNYKICVE